jgi:gliding motility-associated-like protein
MEQLLFVLQNKQVRTIYFLLLLVTITSWSNAQTIYYLNSDEIWRINLENCEINFVVEMEVSNPSEIAFHPDGTLYGLNRTGILFTIDTITGDTNFVYKFSGQLFDAMTCSKSGIIYISGRDGELWTYDPISGIATLLGNLPYQYAGDLTFYKGELYMTSVSEDLIIRIDLNDLPESEVVMTDAGGIGGAMYGIVTHALDCNNVKLYGFVSGNYLVTELDIDALTSDTICILQHLVAGASTTHDFKASDPIRVVDTIIMHPDCGSSNGTITVSTIGGTPPYQYTLNGNPFLDENSFENLSPLGYQIIIEDTRGCSTEVDITLIARDADFIDSLIIKDETCDNQNGRIEVVTLPNNNLQFAIDGVNFQASNMFNQLNQGGYHLTVMNEAGCVDTISVEIDSIPFATISDVQATPTSCGLSNGSITIIAQGGNDISYSIDGFNFHDENLIDLLPSGDFYIYIMDQNGCLDQEGISISESEPLHLDSLQITHPTCGSQNGIATIYISNGSGALSYMLAQSASQFSPTFNQLSHGMYAWSVIDEAGCLLTGNMELSTAGSIEIEMLTAQAADCNSSNGSISIQLENPDTDLTIWVNGTQMGNTTGVNNLPSGEYDILVMDTYGCQLDTTIIILQNQCPLIIANIFSPNGDGVNDFVELTGQSTDQVQIKQFSVFDRWGNELHSLSGVWVIHRYVLWDGNAKDKEAIPGVYTYFLQIENENKEIISYKGDITLVR